jgi:tRNA (mo5U34)-methyltransferase
MLRDTPAWGGAHGALAQRISARFEKAAHGDMARWHSALASLPDLRVEQVRLDATVEIEGSATAVELEAMTTALQAFHPWRKGPFQLFGLLIDTEWRSDWKWQRLEPHLPELTGARVLDVGCGNGYFGWRLLGAGAERVIGIDPTLLFCMQHQAIAHYIDDHRNVVLPLRFEELPPTPFDLVLSMGVVYHRRDPVAHVRALADCLRPGGQLVLESLVVTEGPDIIAPERYARMRNVHAVPTLASLAAYAERAGLTDVRVVDVTPTSTSEQRRTAWMTFESLGEALDPDHPDRTIEGWQAPVRAIVLARKPG